MPNPRYTPRRFTPEPHNFGRTTTISWHPAQPGSEAALAGAQLQHDIAHQLGTAIRVNHRSMAVFARRHNLHYSRMAGMLRGEIILRLEDTAHIAQALNKTIQIQLV